MSDRIVLFPSSSPAQVSISEFNSKELSIPSSIASEEFIGSNFHDSTPETINELNNSATNIWSDLLQFSTQIDIDFQITDLPTGQLAEATITDFDQNGVPNAGTIFIDHDANGVGWFIDETPLDNSEFIAQDTDSFLLAAAESEAEGKYDLLTTVLHELAHLYGFIDGYEGFDANIETEDGNTKFVGDNFTATLDGEHLDKQAHPDDLLNTHLAPGMRKLPSELDVEILQALIATELEQNGSNPAGEELLASLTSDPLLAIANGDFGISDTTTDSFAWDTRGASGIENGQAVLTEDSPFLSNFTQTFTVPESAKTIQFKLIGAELCTLPSPNRRGAGGEVLSPPDAFEVALLDASTNESLIAVSDLSNTDSLLNIQNDGTAYFSDKVRIGGATSGEIIGLDRPRTVTVDISDLTPGTEASLYFDLLGFGDADSRVVIDDVRLSDQFLLPPVANDDTATVTQGETVEIDILANDTDDDGTLDPDSVEITTEPANGTVTVNNDGTVSYTPSDRTIGEDSFTYTVQDNDEQQSQTATVDDTVENAIPEISEVQIPDTVTEGVEVRIGAIASDAGNDELTYSWTIDGEELTENSQEINYTFPDNGTYTGSVTVTDTHGGSDTQTFEVNVENAVPVVNAGVDKTIDEGSSVEFAGSYSDTGANDTHTFTWDFGDGGTADTSEVSHTYTDDGEYTATYTVTDNDGATASNTVEVTVNNVAPIIESLTGDTEINEGDTATFNAIARDAGDDTVTYIWDFGDGSLPSVSGSTVEYLYTDDGNYTVTLTVADSDGGVTTSKFEVTVKRVFNLKAEGKIRINGRSDLNGEALNTSDDTRIYAGSGFTINGNQTFPVQPDVNGNPIKQGKESLLIERAVTVGPNYSESKANVSRHKYVGIIPPQVIEELIVNVPQHNALIDAELAARVAPSTNAVAFDSQGNSLNNARDWNDKFPAPGTTERPTLVTIANGSLNIPNGVDLSNYVIIIEKGDINFNGKGHDLDNVMLINRNGSVNLASVRSNNLSVYASGDLNINSKALFGGNTTLATGNSNSNLNFNGATSTLNSQSNLQVISQGDIIFNSFSTTKGNFTAAGDFTTNGRSSIIGSIQTKGNIRINGGINLQSD